MPFEMKCNMCGVTLRVQEDQVGSIVNCPSCGQVIFVQLPTEGGAASDSPPASQETLAVHFDPVEPELPDFLKPAEAAGPAPALAPQALAETDTVSSLAEMFGAEETSGTAAPKAPATAAPAPQPESPGSIDLSFLTPRPDTEISLDSSAAPAVPAASPVAGGMPWEPPGVDSEPGAAASTFFEPEQTPAPLSPIPVDRPPAAQPDVPEFPWMAPAPAEPATTPAPSPAPFDFMAPAAPTQPATPSPVVPVAPVVFTPPAAVAAQPSQPEFFFPGATEQPGAPSAAPAVTMPLTSATPTATASPKPASRFGVMAAVYVSGVIFGLIIGKFVFGRAVAASGPSGLEAVRDDGMLKDKTKWVDPKATVPSGQLKRLGETVQIAGLSITARSVERAKVTKVHSFGGSKESSHGDCLVLHVRLKNTSKDVEFAPLDPMFVRPHNKRERPTYSYIEVPGGEPIGMFDLHKFSEFDLEGQPFDVIKPGEEIEAIIAAAEDSPAQAKGKMHWRVQVRAGVPEKKAYTTVVGFEFTPEQIRG